MIKNPFGRKTPLMGDSRDYGDGESCTIRFLDDSEPLAIPFKRDTKGSELMNEVCKQLDLVEKDYFGLRFVDVEKQRHWLDLTKSIHRQLKNVKPMVLCFRVKFYPSDPTKLKEEITRYFLFLQLRRDLHHGRLLCSQSDANLLAAHIVQSEFGDFDPDEHVGDYVGRCKMLPKQTERQEEIIADLHRNLRGQTPAMAEAHFLVKASQLDTYGVDPHPVKDQNGNQMYLGVTHIGIITFQGNKKKRLFKWPHVTKITFEGKMFIVHITICEEEEHFSLMSNKHACGFKCPTLAACKHLWKCAVEQQYFYTLHSTAEAPRVASGGGLFNRGSKFRFSGRCEREAYNDSLSLSRTEPRFLRSSSSLHCVRTYANRRTGSVPNTFSALGLSSSSLDSFSQADGISRSLDLDFSTTATMDAADQVPIPEEESPMEFSDAVSDPLHLAAAASAAMNNANGVTNNNNAGENGFPPNGSNCDDGAAAACFDPANPNCSVLSDGVLANTVVSNGNGHTSCNGISSRTAAVPSAVASTVPSRVQVCAWAVVLAALFIFATIVAIAFVLLEADTDVPILREIRRLPEICEFRRDQYAPWRNWLLRLDDDAAGDDNIQRWPCIDKLDAD